jgi:hypothetical protein
MGKFKALDIEQKEMLEEDIDFDQVMQEMWERNILQGAAELCRREDYGYSKFLDELHKALNEARGNSETK